MPFDFATVYQSLQAIGLLFLSFVFVHRSWHAKAQLASLAVGEANLQRVAARYEVSRQDQDEFALRSHQRAVAAQEAGRFDSELVPVAVAQKKGDPITVTADPVNFLRSIR